MANPVFTGTITGIQNGENITATYSTPATIASSVGLYSIIPALVDPGNKLGNYSVTLHNGTLTIGSSPALTVTANNASRAYGSANPVFSGTITGIQNNDNISATYTSVAVPGSPVGTYAIVPVLVDPDNKAVNYVISYNNALLTVSQAGPLVLHARQPRASLWCSQPGC